MCLDLLTITTTKKIVKKSRIIGKLLDKETIRGRRMKRQTVWKSVSCASFRANIDEERNSNEMAGQWLKERACLKEDISDVQRCRK